MTTFIPTLGDTLVGLMRQGFVLCEGCGVAVYDLDAHSPHDEFCAALGDCTCDRRVCEACCPECSIWGHCDGHSDEHHLWDCMGTWKMPPERLLDANEFVMRWLSPVVIAVVVLMVGVMVW